MDELAKLPALLQYAVAVGVSVAVFLFALIVLWSRYGEYFGLRADKSLADMAGIIGPKPDSEAAAAEADNPTTLVGIVKGVERDLREHIVQYAKGHKIVLKRLGRVEQEVGITNTEGAKRRKRG